MNTCAQVKEWIVENIQVPVEKFVTDFQQACEQFKKWWTEQVQQPIEQFISQVQQSCVQQNCQWLCLCCNKWLCWLFVVIAKVVTWVIVTVVKWSTYWACKVTAILVKLIVMTTLALTKWLVVFVACLVTGDVAGAFKGFRDLWNDLLDIGEEAVDFLKSMMDDGGELFTDVESLVGTLFQGVLNVAELNYATAWISGLIKQGLALGRDAVDVVRDIICNLQDVVFGILRLDSCRIAAGLVGFGADLARLVLLAFRIPGGLAGAPRDEYDLNEVERIVDKALRDTFAGDDIGLADARKKVNLRHRPFGLPVRLDARRFFISSRSETVDLAALDRDGVINLYAAADLATDCKQSQAMADTRRGADDTGPQRTAFLLNRPRWDVVYAGTDMHVDYQTIDKYLQIGPMAVPEFRVYAMRKEIFRRYLDLAVRKAQTIGIRLSWTMSDYEVTHPDEIPVPDTSAGNDNLMKRLGRTGVGDDLCEVPALAIFRYSNDSRNGLTSWYRPGDIHPSGVSFRDRLPEALFRFALIHELGHYFGLDHTGHDGFGHIMYTNADDAGLQPVTPDAVVQILLLAGEPRFTVEDARTAWAWITTNARACLTNPPPTPAFHPDDV